MIDNWDETDDETGEKVSINLRKKISNMTSKFDILENTIIGLSNQNSNMSGEIKTLQDTIKIIDHRFDIHNNRFADKEKKIKNIPSMIVPRSESIPNPVTPPVIVPTESVIPLTNPKADGGGRVVRWSWVNFQCRGVLQFG